MKKLLKKLSVIAITLITVNQAFAQDPDFDKEGHTEYREYHKNKKPHSLFSKRDFGLYLGLNTFYKPDGTPELKDFPSRYVALQWRKNHKLITGKQMDVALGTGLEVGWNNFMLKEDEKFISIGEVSTLTNTDKSYEKVKLVNTTLSIPVMLQFGFKESDFRFGIGAYGGMRVNSYQKFKQNDGDKFREKEDFNLRKFNYGLTAEAGKGDFRLFVKYDILPAFNDANPINGNTISFGVRL